MLSYDWNFGRIAPYVDAFWGGLAFTVTLSFATITFATVVGVLWGAGLARSPGLRLITTPVLDVLRSLPPLVLVLFGYYFYVQDVVGFSVPAFWAFVLSLGFNVAAFIADLTRASILNTPSDYVEVAKAMGLSRDQTLRHVIAPIAVRQMIAPLSYIYIDVVKLTSLASVISVSETVYVAQSIIIETSRSLEVWVIVGAIYVALILPATLLVRRIEARLSRSAGLAP
jgi:His/Glu/Gln/Arg/opine family amino acid ABC transporter permease subunit